MTRIGADGSRHESGGGASSILQHRSFWPGPVLTPTRRAAAKDRLHGLAFCAYAVSVRGEGLVTRFADAGGVGHGGHRVEP